MCDTRALCTFTSARSAWFVGGVSSPDILLLALSTGVAGTAAATGSEAPLAAFRPRTDMAFLDGVNESRRYREYEGEKRSLGEQLGRCNFGWRRGNRRRDTCQAEKAQRGGLGSVR